MLYNVETNDDGCDKVLTKDELAEFSANGNVKKAEITTNEEYIQNRLEQAVDEICADILDEHGLESGDISPEASYRIDEKIGNLKKDLCNWMDRRLST